MLDLDLANEVTVKEVKKISSESILSAVMCDLHVNGYSTTEIQDIILCVFNEIFEDNSNA